MAQKKSNLALWLGLGCGGLLLLSVIGSAVVYFVFAEAAEELEREAAKAASGSGTPGSTGTSTSAGSGSGTCAQAAQCCKAMILKTGGNADALANCEKFKDLPEIGCVQSLDSFRKSAPAVGAKCD